MPLLAAVVGNSLGGWTSDHLVARIGLHRARRRVAVFGFAVVAVVFLPFGALLPTVVRAVACWLRIDPEEQVVAVKR